MRFVTLALGLSALALATVANAAPNIVQNGGFEITTGTSGEFGDRYTSNTVANWSTSGYNWLFTAGSADTACNNGEYGCLQLWGPANGSANGLTATSPHGGNYVAADGAFTVGAIAQTLATVAGHQYAITFDFAGAQQYVFDGATTEAWTVCLGTDCQSTPTLVNADHGFTGWTNQTFIFTAQTANDVLSFLAVGTPDGEPPFSLLDGVTGTDVTVPEAGSIAVLGLGLGLAAVARRRK